ncbi:MAG: hypothetical protein WAL31_10275, partial [Gaiellaceae bacterium]
TLACAGLVGVLLLTGAAVSQAKTRVTWTTPQAIAKKIHGLVPQIPTTNTSAPSIISVAACHGVGKAHRAGKSKRYSTFRCKALWERGISRVWARALPGGKFCASSTGLAACPAGNPVAGDPRICSISGAPPTADPNHCALTATEAALTRAMAVAFNLPTWQPGNVACKGSNLTRTCSFQQLGVYGVYYKSKIRFALTNGAWSATIGTTGGNVPATCTVLPKAGTAAGKPSKWTTGPTPTC